MLSTFRAFRDFLRILDLHALLVTLLALASTYLCLRFKWTADIPTNLIGLAVVFPIVFSINAAYKRREEALGFHGSIKAHSIALYYAHRDWAPAAKGAGSEHAARVRALVEELLAAVRADLSVSGRRPETLAKVFAVFSKLSASHEELRKENLGVSEVSRANQYLGKMMVDFERMRAIAIYRTPIALRAYSRVFLNAFPIAFGPYFAFLSTDSATFPWVGYLVAVLYSLVLVCLDDLQEHLEDPYDEVGTDDLKLDVVDEYRPFLEAE
jgi:predicted membrane chloride channel (bestrophin family)